MIKRKYPALAAAACAAILLGACGRAVPALAGATPAPAATPAATAAPTPGPTPAPTPTPTPLPPYWKSITPATPRPGHAGLHRRREFCR